MDSERNNAIPIFESSSKSSSKNTMPSKKPKRCYIASAVGLLIIIAIALTLAFTVFRVKEPKIIINSISFDIIDLTRNITVTADVTVTNPNALAFAFASSRTNVMYRRKEVGSGTGPPGKVGARGQWRAKMKSDLITERLTGDPQFLEDVMGGSVGLETVTAVGGHVKILGIEKKVDLTMNCKVNVSVISQVILGQKCTQHMRL